jgi:hypothetical protein
VALYSWLKRRPPIDDDLRRAHHRSGAADLEALLDGNRARPALRALDQGGVPASEIGRLRAGLATNCTMCHAKKMTN